MHYGVIHIVRTHRGGKGARQKAHACVQGEGSDKMLLRNVEFIHSQDITLSLPINDDLMVI